MKNDKQIIMDISLIQGLCWSFSTGLTMAMSGISFYLSAKMIDDGDENWITGHNIQADDYILFIISLVVGLNNAGMLVPIVHYI
mmetsp:Transcript_10324/g.1546  ORF Transcript_10324/g.1546 Transcript_10324/m.1546 type:complete len:84 (+) Transcript_10324:235-486(+)